MGARRERPSGMKEEMNKEIIPSAFASRVGTEKCSHVQECGEYKIVGGPSGHRTLYSYILPHLYEGPMHNRCTRDLTVSSEECTSTKYSAQCCLHRRRLCFPLTNFPRLAQLRGIESAVAACT